MDSKNVYSRTLLEYTVGEKISTASARRAKVYDAKERGYCSIKLAEDLMDTLNQNFGVRETLSNLVKFTRSSEFVFQQEDALSETMLLRTLVIILTHSLNVCSYVCNIFLEKWFTWAMILILVKSRTSAIINLNV